MAEVTQSVEPAEQPMQVRPGPPPLRIHHLMACAAVAAVQLSLWRAIVPQAAQMGSANAVMAGIMHSFGAIGLTLALFSIYWQCKGLAGLVQPGQWLLINYAVSAVRFYVIMLLFMTRVGPRFWPGSGLITSDLDLLLTVMSFVVVYIVPTAFYLWCVFKVADTWPWRFVFLVLAFISIASVQLLFPMLMSWASWPPKVSIGVLTIAQAGAIGGCEVWAALSDLASERRRYWTHWVGVLLALLGHLFSFVMGVLYVTEWI